MAINSLKLHIKPNMNHIYKSIVCESNYAILSLKNLEIIANKYSCIGPIFETSSCNYYQCREYVWLILWDLMHLEKLAE